jgi:hypothetical protein
MCRLLISCEFPHVELEHTCLQDNRDACIDEFVKSCPEIGAFVDYLQLHGDASQRLISMCAEIPVAWMVVDTSMLCRALSKEALKWQQGYGRALVDWVYRQVEALRDFFDTTEDELRRPVVQLKQLNGQYCCSCYVFAVNVQLGCDVIP